MTDKDLYDNKEMCRQERHPILLIMRAEKPVPPILAHHNPLINHLAPQARNVIMKLPQNGVDLFLFIEPSPFKGTSQLFHDITPLLILRRNADQPTFLEECCHYTRPLVTLRWQRIAGKEHLRHVLRTIRQALNTVTIQFIIA